MLATCPSRKVLDLIADKWVVLVVRALSFGTRRHGELGRTIEGISEKMLSQTLRRLERDGLIARKVYPVIPPKVEYSLTDLGWSLNEVVESLSRWAEGHIPEVEAARERYAAVDEGQAIQ
jgi:DNA-binding HxlR family transcriptional regulator